MHSISPRNALPAADGSEKPTKPRNCLLELTIAATGPTRAQKILCPLARFGNNRGAFKHEH